MKYQTAIAGEFENLHERKLAFGKEKYFHLNKIIKKRFIRI